MERRISSREKSKKIRKAGSFYRKRTRLGPVLEDKKHWLKEGGGNHGLTLKRANAIAARKHQIN